jgi:hypothetical protein
MKGETMLVFRKQYFYILVIIIFIIPGISTGKILGNSGGRAGPDLEFLTNKASVNTLQATVEMYKMISHIEDPDKDNISYAKSFSQVMKLYLDDSVRLLRKATDLPSSEFDRMNKWLNNTNLRNYSQRYNIPREDPIWQEISDSVKSRGGRGWLQQSIRLNENLILITNKFVEDYSRNPMPAFAWELIRNWTREMYRGIYLSIILTE